MKKSLFSVFCIAVAAIYCPMTSCTTTLYTAAHCNIDKSDSLSFSHLDMKSDIAAGIYYKLSYSDSFLVLECCVLNEVTQQKILMSGLSVWIDTTNKTKKETAFIFPYKTEERKAYEADHPRDNLSKDPMVDFKSPGDVMIIRNGEPNALSMADGGDLVKAQMQINTNRVLRLRVAISYQLLGFSAEALSTSPFSMIITTSPLARLQLKEGSKPNGSDNGAETGNPYMYGNSSQLPFGQGGSGNYGNPGGGNYSGQDSGGVPENNSATKSDKIVVKHIVFEKP